MNLPKWLIYFSLFALYLLHNDLWYWSDARFVVGVPVGLFYHIAFCIATSILFIFMVKHTWPSHLEVEEERSR